MCHLYFGFNGSNSVRLYSDEDGMSIIKDIRLMNCKLSYDSILTNNINAFN